MVRCYKGLKVYDKIMFCMLLSEILNISSLRLPVTLSDSGSSYNPSIFYNWYLFY